MFYTYNFTTLNQSNILAFTFRWYRLRHCSEQCLSCHRNSTDLNCAAIVCETTADRYGVQYILINFIYNCIACEWIHLHLINNNTYTYCEYWVGARWAIVRNHIFWFDIYELGTFDSPARWMNQRRISVDTARMRPMKNVGTMQSIAARNSQWIEWHIGHRSFIKCHTIYIYRLRARAAGGCWPADWLADRLIRVHWTLNDIPIGFFSWFLPWHSMWHARAT